MNDRKVPGLTLRSIPAAILGMLFLCGFYNGGRLLGSGLGGTGLALSAPAVGLLFALVGCSGFLFLAWRRHLLSRAELLTVFFAMLLTFPAMHGVWFPLLRISSTITRGAEFERIDALPERLWPHGEDLLEGHFGPDTGVEGDRPLTWAEVDFHHVGPRAVAGLENPPGSPYAAIRIPLALRDPSGRLRMSSGEPYLVQMLIRARELESGSRYFCRIYFDDSEIFAEEPFSAQQETKVTYLQREGFARMGAYGIVIPPDVTEKVVIEVGLEGGGALEVADPQWFSVGAIEQAFAGREVIDPEAYAGLPETRRAAYLSRPESWLSPQGLRFLFVDYIRLGDWAVPALAWGSFFFILSGGAFIIVMMMRRQWIDNERLPLPLAQIPRLLLGTQEADEGASAWPGLWHNRLFWVGFGGALFWGLMKGWALISPAVPDMNIFVPLKPYFNNPDFGGMWTHIYFGLSAMIIGLALFVELNILMSVVVGFFLYRAQHWFGEVNGLSVDNRYPYNDLQLFSGYMTYGLVTLAFAWKYIAGYFSDAWRGITRTGDFLAPRANVVLMVVFALAMVAWVGWIGLPPTGCLLLTGILLATALVAAKLRAECGIMSTDWGPYRFGFALPAVGGMAFFGIDGVLFGVLLSNYFISIAVVMAVGPQLEFCELAREARMRKSHIFGVIAFGLVVGFVISGWTYLSAAYAIGVENASSSNAFNSMRYEMRPYSQEITTQTEAFLAETSGEAAPADGEAAPEGGSWFTPDRVAMLYAAAGTAVTATLRQLFAGFWFHPVGFVLGPSWALPSLWSSLLAAALIRFTVLKLGGAAAVREKLFPIAVGLFTGGCFATLAFAVVTHFLHAGDAETTATILSLHGLTRLF